MNMELVARPHILDHLSVLADATRCRILLAISRQELTVGELCSVVQLPQSTVSRHLKVMVDGGWSQSRREGTHRLYRLVVDDLDTPARSLWMLTREEMATTATAGQDARRLEEVLAQRRSRSQEFFASSAGQWDKMRDELFGSTFYLQSLLGLLDEDWAVADLGCGSGPVSEALAPFVGQVFGIDGSQAMLDAAAQRLRRFDNIELRRGELEDLPLGDGRLDAATLILVLHHLPEPDRALREVARVLRPGGKVLLVDMLPHDRQEYQQQMGHVWLGFSEEQLARMVGASGLRLRGVSPLPVDPSVRGPGLFAATASRVF